jgi:hypothetical protein
MHETKLSLSDTQDLLRGALAFRDASLVLYRHKMLVEFKTEKLGAGLSIYEEDGYVSYQIGDFDGHHCHVDVGACTAISFGAEPVSCQGGRLNYTVWFLVDEDCGNPYRKNAYFSVTLNRPYEADGTVRRDIVEQVFRLYQAFADKPGVVAEASFLQAMDEFMPQRVAA